MFKKIAILTCVVSLSLVLSLVGALAFSQEANAEQILVEAPSAGGPYYGMYTAYGTATSFTLTSGEYISTISVVLRTPSTTSFTTFDFSLQDSLISPFTTFASASLTAPLGSISTEVINVYKILPAGTYYLVGIVPGYAGTPVTPGNVDGWMLSTGVYNNAAGTVTDGVWVFNGDNWSLLSGNYFNNGTLYYAPAFSVNGSPSQLPQTGQTTCYDSDGNIINCGGTGQDGNLRAGAAWPNPRFIVSGDCVTDNLTGLMWTKDGNLAGTRTWQGALDWVATLNSGGGLCGYLDWRLPNLNELKSLVNRQQSSNANWLNSQGFNNIQGSGYVSCYWSSSTYAAYTGQAWCVDMYVGNVSGSTYGKGNQLYVWPVRLGQ